MCGNVIFSTYYTGKPNPQKTAIKAVPSDFNMIQEFYKSVIRLGLQAIIFHDLLTKEFVGRYSTPNFQFIKVPYHSQRGLNDERFYVYLDMLKRNPNIEWVLATDLFDVDFVKDPFEFINDKTKIYVGQETPAMANFGVIKNLTTRAYGGLPDWWAEVDIHLLNAGIVGGHRDVMLDLLTKMVDEFNTIDQEFKMSFTDMFVLSRCIHGYKMPFITGSPLHSVYKRFEKDGDFYIRHK
jgi:hypothetical protein